MRSLPFARSFHFLTYASTLWAFLTLLSTGTLHWWAVAVFLVAYLVAVTRHRSGFALPNFVWLLISLAAFSAALYGWFRIDRMYSVAYFIMFLAINKMLTASRNRDYLQLYGLMFFHVLAASVSTNSVVFAPMLIVYVFLTMATVMTFTIKRDAERTFDWRRRGFRSKSPHRPVPVRTVQERTLSAVETAPYLHRAFAGRLAAATVVVVILGTALFFIVPRTAESQFLPGLGRGRSGPRQSGFADHVSFGGVGDIQSDPTIVMRVMPQGESRDQRPEYLRIRGTALDQFDGRVWRKSPAPRAVSEYRTTDLALMDQPMAEAHGLPFAARINLDPELSEYLFTINQPVRLQLDTMRMLELDESRRSVRHLGPRYNTISYFSEGRIPAGEEGLQSRQPLQSIAAEESGEKDLVTASREALEAYAPQIRKLQLLFPQSEARSVDLANLQVPTGPDMEVVEDLAAAWTEGLTDPHDKAREIERRFRTEFGYTLKVDFSNRPNHISHFLRVAREGHCEYFATGMALMLRSQGIPARVVNGYLTDEWNRTGGGYYVVRQEHAHSWVEALMNDDAEVWTTFDPTPATGIGSNRIHRGFYHWWTAIADAVKLRWYNLFVDFGVEDQRAGFIAVIRSIYRGARGLNNIGRDLQNLLGQQRSSGSLGNASAMLMVGVVLFVVAAGAVVYWWRRSRKAKATPPKGPDLPPLPEIVRPYVDLLDDLAHVLPRSPAQTPLRYAQSVIVQTNGALADFLPVTEQYYAIRFDGALWTPDLSERIRALRERTAQLTQQPTAVQPTV